MAHEGTQDSTLQRPGSAKVYNRTKILLGIVSSLLSFVLLLLVVVTDASRIVAAAASLLTGSLYGAVLLFSLIIGVAQFVATLPIGFYSGYVIEHRYALSNQTLTRWAWEHVKGLLVGLPIAVAALLFLYYCLLTFTGLWWIPVAAAFALFSVVLVRLGPVLLFPLFYRFTQLTEGPLLERIVALCSRAGIRFKGVYTFNLSKNTKKANAGFTGIGKAKRIILGDTLIQEFTHDEIVAVFAHELGHYAHRHLAIGLVIGTVSTFVGLFVAATLHAWSVHALGFSSITDIAALPLLAIWLSVFGVVTAPLGNALSRHHERQADRYAVETSGDGQAFASALRKLAAQNLADPAPHPLIEFFFYSHPSITRRIAALEQRGAR
jgi:STE24 endopeptidase